MPVRQGSTVPLRLLLILLTAAGLLPLALVGGWSLHSAAAHGRDEQARAALDLARALSSTVDAELDGAIATLASMARAPAIAAGDLPAFHDIARAQAAAQPEWLGVLLTDGEGRVLLRTTAPFGAQPGSIADPGSLAQALALRRPVIGHVARGKGGRLAFPVRFPLFDARGHLYVLNAVIRPDRIERALGRQHLPPGATVTVLDSAGSVVAGSAAPAAGLSSAAPERAGSFTDADGNRRAGAATRLSRHGWTVAVSLPAPSAAHLFAGYGAGIAVSLLLCSMAALLIASRIVRRIERLRVDAAALGAGEPVSALRSRIREIDAMGQALQAAGIRIQAAAHAKDEFLAVLGHELRNPLSPIATALDLMDMRDEPANRRERAILRRQVTHLKRLVDDLLDVSRIATGKLGLAPAPLNLAELVRDSAGAAAQPVDVVAPDALWIQGDESRLAQVLNNLLSNAARFGSTATRVTLTAASGRAHIAVRDNGIGMDAALVSRVFEPFYQAPQPLARRTGGLGLGLAIVRRIVELHGGRVSARSGGPGQGSCFEVELPVGSPGPAFVAPEAVRDGAARRVLLVDDNVDAATVTAALLARAGHAVEVAHSGQAALAAARRCLPEVAILDIGLPDMDGYALAAALRALGRDMRIVALTGYGQAGDVARATAAGFDLHLTKPATVEDLRRAVDRTRAETTSS